RCPSARRAPPGPRVFPAQALLDPFALVLGLEQVPEPASGVVQLEYTVGLQMDEDDFLVQLLTHDILARFEALDAGRVLAALLGLHAGPTLAEGPGRWEPTEARPGLLGVHADQVKV